MRRPSTLAFLALLTIACGTRANPCGSFAYDETRRVCVCPMGTVQVPDAGACRLPDGGELRFDGSIDDASTCVPEAETCNGRDDDCDGVIDGPAAAASCELGPNAESVACTAGTCVITDCTSGFADCDSDPTNGCDSSLDTVEHCGSCANTCGWACERGVCDDAIAIDTYLTAHTCILRESGRIACWGLNEHGELGTGESGADAGRVTPTHVLAMDGAGPFEGAAEVDVGSDHTCARTEGDGRVWCWGRNDSRQLGDGTTTARTLPVPTTIVDAVSVAAGASFSCAVLRSGAVWCWGANDRGQLGGGHTAAREGPEQVVGVTNAVRVDAGSAFACATLADRGVRCWGDNRFSALGVADWSIHGPVAPTGIADVVDLGVSREGACALRDDGTVWCWGSNYGLQMSERLDATFIELPTEITSLPLVPAHLTMDWRALIVDSEGRVATLDAELDPGALPARTAASGDPTCVLHRDGSVRCSLTRSAPFVDVLAP